MPTVAYAKGMAHVSLEVTSIWDRLLRPNQLITLNGAWLKTLDGAATGLDKVYLARRTVPWGAPLPAQATTTVSSGNGVGAVVAGQLNAFGRPYY